VAHGRSLIPIKQRRVILRDRIGQDQRIQEERARAHLKLQKKLIRSQTLPNRIPKGKVLARDEH